MKRIGIVNRGEAAARFQSTLDALRREDPNAPEAVALYTEPDADSHYVRSADYAIPIGDGSAAYLDAEGVLRALRDTGCDAAWLGWGFASEDADFAETLEAGGIILLGPRGETMRALGDKIQAKQMAELHQVPVAPWAIVSDTIQALREAERIEYPVLLKAAGGGGGRGIRRVDRPADLDDSLIGVRAEVARSFRSQGVLIEKCVETARHIEVQIFGDGEGGIRVLGVRDCSLQRRRQKVLEECPAPKLPEARRIQLEEAAARLGAAVKYRSAGTVEFLYDPIADAAYFLEVNTRLQVEHPVTELVYGVDLVRWQIDLARGYPLPETPVPRGWAVEARVCAEDAANDFIPAPGRLARFVLPVGPGIRVDTGFVELDTIASQFDPLIAKIIAWGPTRATAIARLTRALEQTRIIVEGGRTNLAFLKHLLQDEAVRRGDADINFIDHQPPFTAPGADFAIVASAIDRFLANGDQGIGTDRHRVDVGGPLLVYRTGPERFRIVGEEGSLTARWRPEDNFQSWLGIGEKDVRIERAPGDTTYVVDGVPHRVQADSGGAISSPSMAMVLSLPVKVGDTVSAGECVVILESMKMEVRVEATRDGTIGEIRAQVGAHVEPGQLLVVLETGDTDTPTDGPTLPWTDERVDATNAAGRLTAAVIGWDLDPAQFNADIAALDGMVCLHLLRTYADIAELFERRPIRFAEHGARAEAVTTAVSLHTVRLKGPDALPAHLRELTKRALAHLGVDSFDPTIALHDALDRLQRGGVRLGCMAQAIIIALRAVESVPIKLLDRLTSLDPDQFGPVVEAADRRRYQIYERPAHQRLTEQSEVRANTFLEQLRAGEISWEALYEVSESLTCAMALPAAGGDHLASEVLARRLEWQHPDTPVVSVSIADRTGWRIGDGDDVILVVCGYMAEATALLDAAGQIPGLKRFEMVLVTEPDQLQMPVTPKPLPWSELCVMMVSGPGMPQVRRYNADGSERIDRRDILPTTARRFDLDRLSRFDFERLPTNDDVVLFLARAHDNARDQRLLAYAEVRSLKRRAGRPLHLPHVDRVFHAAIRAIQAAREQHDPRHRMHWNRLTIVVLPVIPLGPEIVRRYIARLAPMAQKIGLEKVVIRARFADPTQPDGISPLHDLSIFNLSGHRLEFVVRPASNRPLMPLSKYESRVVTARRRGLVYPYEIITMLEGGGHLPPGRFEEYDVNEQGQPISVGGRARGENTSGIVFGLMRTRSTEIPSGLNRVLLLSDPTDQMGALAEPECRRVIAALDLADRQGLPIEWVAVSGGARIDWESGTENLDWTARVLARIVRFTQSGGEIHIVVPGICVGAQAYWNAEATMMMHTRGFLIMTDRGAMVLTGKRALDVSGCVSAEDNLALGGYTAVMGPNGQAQAHAPDLGAAYRLLYRFHALTYCPPGTTSPRRIRTPDKADRDVTLTAYPSDLGHGFETIGQLFSLSHNPDRKRPFAVRPVMAALVDEDVDPIERWGGMHGAETAIIWEARVGGHAAMLIGIDNQPVSRLGPVAAGGPEQFAGGTLYPQASRKVARALNAASGRRPVVVLANLSGFDGSPESLRSWQLEYGAEIGRAVVNFDGPILFVVLSRYHGGAYVVFSKALNPRLVSIALEGSYASVIGGAPAAAVVFAGEVRKRVAERGGGDTIKAQVTAELAAKFDAIHTVERAQAVGSIDAIIDPTRLRPYVIDLLTRDRSTRQTTPPRAQTDWHLAPSTTPPEPSE